MFLNMFLKINKNINKKSKNMEQNLKKLKKQEDRENFINFLKDKKQPLPRKKSYRMLKKRFKKYGGGVKIIKKAKRIKSAFQKKQTRKGSLKFVYSKKTVKLVDRMLRIKKNYQQETLSFDELKLAILKSRFISYKNPRINVVVSYYLNLFLYVDLNEEKNVLLKKIEEYFFEQKRIKNPYKKTINVLNFDNERFKQLLICERRNKKKRKNKRKKHNSCFCKKSCSLNSNKTKEKSVLPNVIDLERCLYPINLIEKRFKKIANIKQETKTFGKKNTFISIDFALGHRHKLKSNKANEKKDINNSVLLLKNKIEGICFNKTYYINGSVSYDLFIKPEYAYAQKEIKKLLELINQLVELFSLSESFSSNSQQVIDVIELIKNEKKPILKKVV